MRCFKKRLNDGTVVWDKKHLALRKSHSRRFKSWQHSLLIFFFCLALLLDFSTCPRILFLWYSEEMDILSSKTFFSIFHFLKLRKGLWVTLAIQVFHSLQNQSPVIQERSYSEIRWKFLWQLPGRREDPEAPGMWKKGRGKTPVIPLASSFLSFSFFSYEERGPVTMERTPDRLVSLLVLWLLARKKCCPTYKKLWISVN